MRTMGETIAISIGTSIPIESIMNDAQVKSKYDTLYINVKTLFRNFYASFDQTPIIDKVFLIGFIDEISQIINYFQNSGYKLILYYTSYKSISKIFPEAKLKNYSTKKQIEYLSLESTAISSLLRSEIRDNVNLYDCKVKGEREKALIITNFPVDLLSKPNFNRLALLESHTGAIKLSSLWTQKLTANSEYHLLPFNGLTIQIIGDKSNLFNNSGKEYIRGYLRIASENKWSPVTTMEKCKYDIKKDVDRFLSIMLLKMIPNQLI